LALKLALIGFELALNWVKLGLFLALLALNWVCFFVKSSFSGEKRIKLGLFVKIEWICRAISTDVEHKTAYSG